MNFNDGTEADFLKVQKKIPLYKLLTANVKVIYECLHLRGQPCHIIFV